MHSLPWDICPFTPGILFEYVFYSRKYVHVDNEGEQGGMVSAQAVAAYREAVSITSALSTVSFHLIPSYPVNPPSMDPVAHTPACVSLLVLLYPPP